MKISYPINKQEVNDLVKEIARGNTDATAELYTKMYPILFHFLLKYEYDPQLVKEAISATFCTVVVKSTTRLFFTNCFSWIITIAKYHLKNIVRSQNKVIISSDKIDCVGVKFSENRLALNYAMSFLSKDDKRILYLFYYHGLELDEVSRMMKVSLRTIERKKAEIIDVLKERMKDA